MSLIYSAVRHNIGLWVTGKRT